MGHDRFYPGIIGILLQKVGAAAPLATITLAAFNFSVVGQEYFRGVSAKAFDGAGNYTLGLKEQIVFPEIDFDKVEKIKGMNITFVTTAGTDEEAKELLANLGMPFRSS